MTGFNAEKGAGNVAAHSESPRRANAADACEGGKPMRILVTGGTGYIGCHTCLVLLARGHHVVVADNLSNS